MCVCNILQLSYKVRAKAILLTESGGVNAEGPKIEAPVRNGSYKIRKHECRSMYIC